MASIEELANELPAKERIFADEFIKTTNATQSMITAGYSAKTADVRGSKMLRKPRVRQYIDAVMAERSKDTIATADEVLEYLTRVVRGEELDQFGLDVSVADKTKAAELLGKRYMLFTDKVKLDAEIEIDITDRLKNARVKADESE